MSCEIASLPSLARNDNIKKKRILWLLAFIFVIISVFLIYSVEAADKEWISAGDGASWADGKNWRPEGIPNTADNVTVDFKDASVICDRTFGAKTLTVGGTTSSAMTKNNFVSGTISPSSASDDALHIRKNGLVTLKGLGTITLKGKFKSTSEEGSPGEESFMFTLE